MHVFTVAWREFRAIFHTTIGWLVLAGFLLVTGFFWSAMVSYYVQQSTDIIANPYAESQVNLTDYLLSPFFGNTAVVLLMMSPALSMRLFSEELKNRTMELLFTSPLTTAEIVLGKYLGALGFVAVMLLCTAYMPAMLYLFGDVDRGALIGGYLSVFLVAASVIALGMLFSAMTSNQIVALVLGFAGALAVWLFSWSSGGPDSIMQQLSIATHLDDLMRGAVNLSDLVYFASFIGFFVLATHQRVEAYRWR